MIEYRVLEKSDFTTYEKVRRLYMPEKMVGVPMTIVGQCEDTGTLKAALSHLPDYDDHGMYVVGPLFTTGRYPFIRILEFFEEWLEHNTDFREYYFTVDKYKNSRYHALLVKSGLVDIVAERGALDWFVRRI